MPVKDVHSNGLSCFASRKSWFSQLLGHARGPDCKVLPYAYIHDLAWGVLQPLCWQLVGCSDLLSGVLRCVGAQAVFEQIEELSWFLNICDIACLTQTSNQLPWGVVAVALVALLAFAVLPSLLDWGPWTSKQLQRSWGHQGVVLNTQYWLVTSN